MIELNGFRLEFSAPTFTAYRQHLPDSDQLRLLKERLGDAWFLYWDNGVVLGLPRVDGAPPFGEQLAWIIHERMAGRTFLPVSMGKTGDEGAKLAVGRVSKL